MERLSRRNFLRWAGAAGVAGTVSPALLLSACGEAATVQGRTGTLSPPTKPDTAKLNMRIWGAYPDFVRGNVQDFETETGNQLDLGVIAGDYPSIVQNLLRQRYQLDMFYSLGHTPKAWKTAGWLQDYERFWDKNAAEQEMLPQVREALTVDGKLIGLPYFAFINGALFANTDVLKKAGVYGEWPTTYDELYAQVRKIKQTGASDTPYSPSFWSAPWFGIPFGFIQEALNRKIPLFGKGGQPLFDETSPIVHMLEQWRGLYRDKLVPQGILTFQEQDWTEIFAKGGIAYSPQLQYDLKTFADPSSSQVVGKIVAVPQKGQNWGMLHVGIYLIGNYKQSDDRLAHDYLLAQYFGYRDHKTKEFGVPLKWAQTYYLTQGYAAVNNDPRVRDAAFKWLPDPESQWPILEDYLAHPDWPTNLFHTLWALEWMTYASSELPNAVNGQSPIPRVVKNLKDKAESLIAKYS